MKQYYVYMIRCDDNSLYTGIACNIEKRMFAHIHKLKEAASYTKSRNVVSLEALWLVENRSTASKLEHLIKKLSKKQKETIIDDHSLIESDKRISIQASYFSDKKYRKKL